MSKFYSVLNLKRQQNGPSVITEKGLKELQGSQALAGSYSVIGECDAHGNLLSSISEGNFVSAPVKERKVDAVKKDTPKPAAPKSKGIPDIEDDAPVLLDFSEEEKRQLKALKDETKRQGELAIERERAAAGEQTLQETVRTTGRAGTAVASSASIPRPGGAKRGTGSKAGGK